MATFTLNRQDLYPDGTLIGAHARTTDQWPGIDAVPAAAEQQNMTTDGAPFTALDPGRYWFHGANGAVVSGTVGADRNPPPWLTGQQVPEVTGEWPLGSPGVALSAALDELGLIVDSTTEAVA